MKHSWAKLLNIIFPLSEDEQIIQSHTTETFAKEYSITRVDTVVALAAFKDKKVRAAIHLNKFHGHFHARQLLASLLIAHLNTLKQQPYLLIPIPLSSKREQERGYNQVTVVAKEAIRTFPHITLASHLLKKQKHTVPQTTLTKEERLTNLHNAFFVPHTQEKLLKGAHLILLDDVTTTGTTLKEAKATLLLHHPASILSIALAH